MHEMYQAASEFNEPLFISPVMSPEPSAEDASLDPSPKPFSSAIGQMHEMYQTASEFNEPLVLSPVVLPEPLAEHAFEEQSLIDCNENDSVCTMFRCEGRSLNDKACRKRLSGHGSRGMICPDHADKLSFIRCARGCSSYCHVGCFHPTTRKAIVPNDVSWTCRCCPSAQNIIESKVASSQIEIDVNPHLLLSKKEGYSFQCEKSLHDHMRILGFIQITHHKNTKGEKISCIWKCHECNVRFNAKKSITADGSWTAGTLPHSATCSLYLEYHAEASSKHIMKQHEFARKPGLLEFIETLGACGEVRSDQIARAIAKRFDGFIVEPNLLYRTASKAQEIIFGKTTSDVMALQELSQRIIEGDGVLEFVYGNLHVGVYTRFCTRVLSSLELFLLLVMITLASLNVVANCLWCGVYTSFTYEPIWFTYQPICHAHTHVHISILAIGCGVYTRFYISYLLVVYTLASTVLAFFTTYF